MITAMLWCPIIYKTMTLLTDYMHIMHNIIVSQSPQTEASVTTVLQNKADAEQVGVSMIRVISSLCVTTG